MTFLFNIQEHYISGYLILRVWEVVDSTDKFLYIQPRLIPNKKAEENTTKIKKDVTEHPLTYMNEYHYSTQSAVSAFKQRQEEIINRAERDIEQAKQKLRDADMDLPHQIIKYRLLED